MVVPGAHRRKCGFLLGYLSQTTGLHGLYALNVCGSGCWGEGASRIFETFRDFFAFSLDTDVTIEYNGVRKSEV